MNNVDEPAWVRYQMSCGCTISEANLIFKYGCRLCFNHCAGRKSGRIVHIFKVCKDCGILLMLKPLQFNTLRCLECQKKNHNEITKKSHRKKWLTEVINKEPGLIDESIVVDASKYKIGVMDYLNLTDA